MRRAEVREAILAETSDGGDPRDFSALIVELFPIALPLTFPLAEPIDYEPELDAVGRTRGPWPWASTPWPTCTTSCSRTTARAFYALFGSNFVGGTLDACHEMLHAPRLGDGPRRRRRARQPDLGLLGVDVPPHPLGHGTARAASGSPSSCWSAS